MKNKTYFLGHPNENVFVSRLNPLTAKLSFFWGVKAKILKLGRLKLVCVITLAAVILAILIDLAIAKMLGQGNVVYRAGGVAALVTPIVAWYPTGVLYEIEILKKRLSVLATIDDLTGLYNRREFYKASSILHNEAMSSKKNYCLLLVDLDFFKKINDLYGHAGGDEVLAAFGKVSGSMLRKRDVVGRLGGEEFAFFLPNTNEEQAEKFLQKFRHEINDLVVDYEGYHIKFTVSIGVCLKRGDEQIAISEIIKNADSALYTAKNSGRNQVSIFSN